MANKEHYQESTTLEKGLWWVQVGGAIAAVIGVLNGWVDLAVKGGVVFIGSQWGRDQISKSRQSAIQSSH